MRCCREESAAGAAVPSQHVCVAQQGRRDVPVVDHDDVAFFFATMTWNPDLLEIMLKKAPHPVDMERAAATEAARFAAAYPLPEDSSKSPTCGCRSQVRKQRRARKTKRGQKASSTVPCVFLCEYEDCDLDEESGYACGADEFPVQDTQEELGSARSAGRIDRSHDSILVPHCHQGEWERDAVSCVGGVASMERGNVSQFPWFGMRDFLRVFFQSFLIISVTQAQYKHNEGGAPRSLLPLECKAYEIVHRYKDPFRKILRRYVISGDAEVERRGAQPLFVNGFRRNADCHKEDEKWTPPHEQLFIAGKDPVYQPLLLEMLGIKRVVQCYADQEGNLRTGQRVCDAVFNRTVSGHGERLVHTMQSWRRLLTERPQVLSTDHSLGTEVSSVDEVDLFSPYSEEWERFQEDIALCVRPLQWETYTTFGPYVVFAATLPFSKRRITKLIVPAEDRDTYDLSVHFQEGVFRFIHGTPLFPIDNSPVSTVKEGDKEGQGRNHQPSNSCLLHCAAGMHRSSALAVAYLLWLVALSRGKLPDEGPLTPLLAVGHRDLCKQKKGEMLLESYLTVVLRGQKRDLCPTEMVKSSSFQDSPTNGDTAPTQEEKSELSEGDRVDPSLCGREKSILRRCVDHVRQQRSMAVPIGAALQQLQRYACHLSLV